MPNQTPRGTPNYIWWNLLAGVVFAIAALITVQMLHGELSLVFDNQEGQVTWLTVFAGVFLTGTFWWWWLMSRAERFTAWSGAVAGAFVAFFSYPVVFFLAEFLQRDWRSGTVIASLGERFSNVFLITGLALLTSGVVAIVVLGAVGAVLAVLERRLYRPAAEGTARAALRHRGLIGWLIRLTGYLAVATLVVLSSVLIIFSLLPLHEEDLTGAAFPSHPAQNYEEAMASFAAVQAKEAALPLNPRCLSSVLTHGKKVARAVVFYHGLTNCPAQADVLGKQLFDLGYNVYIPRLPGHGEADVLTLALADLTAEQLVATTVESLDLAAGLGDEVVVAGLSLGGTTAAWGGQYRADISNAVPMAPFFNPHVVPTWASHAATALILALPNFMVWWNPRDPLAPTELNYAYPRYATHALGQTMRLGQTIASAAKREPPLAQKLGMLLNDADAAVSNGFALMVADEWRSHGATVTVDHLPFWRQLPHDIIDPRQEAADIDYVYPHVISLINNTPPPVEPPPPPGILLK